MPAPLPTLAKDRLRAPTDRGRPRERRNRRCRCGSWRTLASSFLVEPTRLPDLDHRFHSSHGSRRDHRMAKVHVEHRWLSHEQLTQPLRRLGDPSPQIGLMASGSPDPFEQSIDHLIEDVVLVPDVSIERHRRDAKFSGQAPDGHLVEVAPANSLRRCVENMRAGDGSPGRPPASSFPASRGAIGNWHPTRLLGDRTSRTCTEALGLRTRTVWSVRLRSGAWMMCPSTWAILLPTNSGFALFADNLIAGRRGPPGGSLCETGWMEVESHWRMPKAAAVSIVDSVWERRCTGTGFPRTHEMARRQLYAHSPSTASRMVQVRAALAVQKAARPRRDVPDPYHAAGNNPFALSTVEQDEAVRMIDVVGVRLVRLPVESRRRALGYTLVIDAEGTPETAEGVRRSGQKWPGGALSELYGQAAIRTGVSRCGSTVASARTTSFASPSRSIDCCICDRSFS